MNPRKSCPVPTLEAFRSLFLNPLFISKAVGGGIFRKGTEPEEVRDSSAHRMKGTKEMPGLGCLTVPTAICEFA